MLLTIIQAEFVYKKDPPLKEQLDYCTENDIPFCIIVKDGGMLIHDIKEKHEEVCGIKKLCLALLLTILYGFNSNEW